MIKYKIILWVFISCCYSMIAQQPASIQLTEKDGLPDIEFYNIIEDSKNYIWLAADEGLYRYNGRSFEHFTHTDQKGNAVFGTTEDTQGRIWCNNISGQFFYTENKKLKLFIDLGTLLNGELSEFIITKDELIVLPGKNIIRVDLKTKAIKKTFSQNVFVGSMEKTSKGYMFSKGNYIVNADQSLRTKDSMKLDVFDNYSLTSGVANRVFVSKNKNFSLCHFLKKGANMFYEFDIGKSIYKKIKVPKILRLRKINHTFFYEHQVWFSTNLGIIVCKLINDTLQVEKHLFKNKFITKIIKDNESNFWVTTKGNGIIVIPNINIFQYEFNSDLNISKFDKVSNDKLVFGTADGKVGIFDNKKQQFKIIDTTSAYAVSEIKTFPSLRKTFIIKEDLVFEFDQQTDLLKKNSSKVIVGAKSFSMFNDSFIVSTYKDARLLNTEYKIEQKLLEKRSYTNYSSKNRSRIYIGGVEGLFTFDKNLKKKEIDYLNKPVLVYDIVETDDKNIWASSFNKGIFGIKNDEIFKNYTIKDGLLSKKISAIKNDGNNLWIATDEGVQFLNTKTGEFKNLTKQNGIPSYRISDIEVIDQNVFFATNTGIFSIEKEKSFKNTKIPSVYISDVSIGLRKMPLKKNYQLNYDQNSIKISFNANGFQSFINNKYEFRLLGQTDIWQTDETTSNTVSFYSLSSGQYTFQVRSILAKKNNLDDIKSIHFTIAKPFWKEVWFYVIVLFVIGITIYIIVKRKIRKIEKQQLEIVQKELINKQLILSQVENLRSQMNPHFIFNALNSIQEYIVFNEKELASSYLIKFSRLIRIYLDHSRENEVLLSEEISALTMYLDLEKNRFEDLLEYEIRVSESLNIHKIKIPSLFIQPYAENALKHGLLHKKNNRKLVIEFMTNTKKDILYCNIKDNGIGIEASKKINSQREPTHKSFATSANQKRVQLINSNRINKISVETRDHTDKENTGTEVVIKIPL